MPPKKSKATSQTSFFHREVPKMPEGYYSSGPNPNLRRFVEEHAKPYDPALDDYDVPPFNQSITSTKATAIYNMHTYWSKKPHDAIQQYIRHYTIPGDLVLDPFSGSGGTSLAALLEGRAAIAIDLSPAATFITKNYCTPVDVDELQRAFEQLKEKVKPEMAWLYETRCDRCDGRATTAYTVYSQIFQCPRCLEKIALYDCIETEGQTLQGKQKKINICPYCAKKGHQEEIRSQSQKFGYKPVLVSYSCEEGCKPRRGFRKHNDSDPKKRLFFEKYDLAKLEEIDSTKIPYPYPVGYDMSGFNRYQRDALWLYGVKEVSDLYTKRNLWALSAYKKAIEAITELELTALLTWTVLKCSRLMRYCDDGIGRITPGTYYIPQIQRDSNVPSFIAEAFGDISAHHSEKIKQLPSVDILPVLISTQDVRHISQLGNETIDYIFTDPPYADKIQYGELNFVWEAWLGFDTTWIKDEIIVNETRGFTDSDWARMMFDAMQECFNVLKPGRWISICYHDTSEGTWQLLQDIMAEVGFVFDLSDKTLYIDASQKTLNQISAEKVTKRDLVINFRKPREGEVAAKLLLSGEEDPASFNEKARMILREALEKSPGATGDRLYDELVSRMVHKGEFQRHNFDALLRSVAEENGGRWYLLETADQLDETESVKENAAAVRLEAFMSKYLKAHPGEGGVHYSNLFEEYLPVSDKPRRFLQDWLPEFFYKTEEGTWRPPFNEEERQVKVSLRLSGELRHIKRFANALSAGVPPAERDRPSNAATLVQWIYQCRRSGLYELGRALYERGGLRFDSLGEDLQLQVVEDYQICVKRGNQIESKPKKAKKAQLDLFNVNE